MWVFFEEKQPPKNMDLFVDVPKVGRVARFYASPSGNAKYSTC